MATWISTMWLKVAGGRAATGAQQKRSETAADEDRSASTDKTDHAKIYTTDMGSQYVLPSEVLRSKAGQRVLDDLKGAVKIEPDDPSDP